MIKCPNCNAMLDLNEDFCQNCGFQIKDGKVLMEGLDYLYELSIMIDSEDIFYDKDKFPLISYLKSSQKLNFPRIYMIDFVIFLNYLGWVDGYLDDKELEFLNIMFSNNYTRDDLRSMASTIFSLGVWETFLPTISSTKLKPYISNVFLISFMIFYEMDLKYPMAENSNLELTEFLLNLYKIMGALFITIDENIDSREEETLVEYINILRNDLDYFKRLGYQDLVNSLNFAMDEMDEDNSQKSVQDEDNEDKLLDKGLQELQNGNYKDAEDTLKNVVKINPNNDFAWSNLCVLYRNIDNNTEALKSINRAIEIDSNNAQYWFNKGDTLFWLGDFQESIHSFDKAIELDPEECDDALAIKGMAFIKLNKMTEAKNSLRECLEDNPKNAFALEAIKNIPNFVNTEILDMDIYEARKLNVNPSFFSKLRHIITITGIAKDNGVSISFESGNEEYVLTHNSKIYHFSKNGNEIDGAIIYAEKVWRESIRNNMSDDERKEIDDIISSVMREQGYD